MLLMPRTMFIENQRRFPSLKTDIKLVLSERCVNEIYEGGHGSGKKASKKLSVSPKKDLICLFFSREQKKDEIILWQLEVIRFYDGAQP